MTTDARLSVGLPSHPKTKKLIRRLGAEGAWYLVRLILWTASTHSDGDLSGMSDEDIELAIDWPNASGALVAALLEVGFLDGTLGNLKFHGWAEHNPWAAGSKQRSEKSKWAALCKSIGKVEAARAMPDYAARHLLAVPESTSGMPQAESSTAPSPKPLPFPIPIPIPLRAALPKERSFDDQILTAKNDCTIKLISPEERDARIRKIHESMAGTTKKAATA